jgi:hypothetical protein
VHLHAIAEGMKSEKHVRVDPASLRDNFSGVEEVRDPSQKKNQFWELEDTVGQPDKKEALAKQLNIPEETIENNGGRGSSTRKDPNFNDLPESKQGEIDDQINIMIKQKYTGINYNGINQKKIKKN